MNPYLADWINQYLGTQLEIGPYKPAYSMSAEQLWAGVDVNHFVRGQPEIFAHITSVYGPDITGLIRFLETKREEYIYQSMFNHVLSTINFSRDGDLYMLQRIDDDSKRMFPLLGELYTSIRRLRI